MAVTFMLKPLVLGATGRIGGALRQYWGAEAALWQTRQAQHSEHPGGQNSGKNWHCFDPLCAPDALGQAAARCGQILCLAGPVPGRGVDLKNHIALAEAAVRAGAATGARVFLASSAAVYGAGQGRLSEDHPLRPVMPYGQAKAEMEARAIQLGRELGVRVCCLRIGNIAGFDAILGGWKPGFRLDQFADGRTPRRSYIGPVTLANVIKTLLASPEQAELPLVVNIAQPGEVEMGALLQAAGRGYATGPAPDHALAEVVLDVTRLTEFLAPQMVLPVADPATLIAEMAMLTPDTKDDLAR